MSDSGGGILYSHQKSYPEGDFPGGPEVKNLPVSAGDVGSVTVLAARTPRAPGHVGTWDPVPSLLSPRCRAAPTKHVSGK